MYCKGALLAAALLLLTLLDFSQAGDPLPQIRLLYQKGDRLFHLDKNTSNTDAAALADFEQVSAALLKTADFPGKDTLRFQAYLKQGILLDSRADYMKAKSAYCKALFDHPKKDSLSFVANVYLGTIYYNLNDFDSARYFLLAAESEGSRYKDQEDEVRLYNTLGVLYFDNGNYGQGKNYFSRALGIVTGKRPFDTISAVNLQTNIATSYYHLGLFRESLEIYHKILSYHLSDDLINMNMGMAYSSLEHYREALGCFKKVDVREVPGVLNEMGYALLQLHRPDSSARCLDALQSLAASLKLNALDLGTNDFYRADLLAGKGDYLAAIKCVQKAITLFSPNFSREDIYSNPGSFTGAF
jgi:tetratricopeptide (TPR) repeat protein